VLFDIFLHGVSEEVKDELAAWELPIRSRFPHRLDHQDQWATKGTMEGEEIRFSSPVEGFYLASYKHFH
jgi:hypothetical protein